MLSKGVPQVDVSNERSWTALMFAARNGHSGIVRELLKRGLFILIAIRISHQLVIISSLLYFD